MVSERSKNISTRSGLPNFVGKVTSFAFLAHLVQEISLLMVFNMASAANLGRYFELRPSWINVKIVSECIKNLSIRSDMPNLVGKIDSFAFLAHLVQEISLLMVFNMA